MITAWRLGPAAMADAIGVDKTKREMIIAFLNMVAPP
jgi:hypothetical protein